MSERSGAIFSTCRTWRYALWRQWDEIASQMVVIGLNPSTADETEDDPTIRRCIGFAKREGCGKLVMLNLFAFRATQPKDMLAAVDPVGPGHDVVLSLYATDPRTTLAVAAWGTHGTPERVAEIASIFPVLHCLGRNRNGSPKHPLYLPSDALLTVYRSRPAPVSAPMTLTLVVPMPDNLANARMHWRVKHQHKVMYYATLDLMQRAGVIPRPPWKPWPKARISAVAYVGNRMDKGNLMHRVEKWPCDWLKTRGYIVDDRDSCLEWAGFPEQIVKRDGNYRIEITLDNLHEVE